MASQLVAPPAARAAIASGGTAVVRAAELVEVSERLYRNIFRAGLWIASATAVYALALVAVQVGHIDRTVSAITCIALASGLLVAARHDNRAYELLRRRPLCALATASVLATAHIIVGPGSQVLLPPTLIVIGLLATTVSMRSVLAAALLVAIAQASPVLTHELSSHDQRSLLAAAAADLFAPLLFGTLVERLAQFILDLHRTISTADSDRPAPRRVTAWVHRLSNPSPPMAKRSVPHDRPTPAATCVGQLPETASRARTTPRQRQVIALASAGARHAQIAACLAISTGQVTRHLAHARKKAGVDTTEQLVAWAINRGLIPRPGSE